MMATIPEPEREARMERLHPTHAAPEAPMPRFVAHTAEELVAMLRRLLAEPREAGADAQAFWDAFRQTMSDLNVVLEFGEAIAEEELDAARRYEALRRRVEGRSWHPMLAAPVADLLDTLEGLIHRLDAGLFHLCEFHHTFEEVAGRLDCLLAWQAALEGVESTPPNGVTLPHFDRSRA